MSTPRQSDEKERSGFRVGTRTHIGLRRKRNEDFLDVRSVPRGMLMVVCDGMGGPGNGDRASRLAVEAFMAGLNPEADAAAILRDGVARAGRAIIDEIGRSPELAGMGTTMVAAVVRDRHATIANVGDSRGYLFHDGILSRITRDHSLVGEMVAAGKLTEEEAAHHPRRNIITRALGGEPVEADLYEVDLADGDILLLATDGLHGMIGDAEIADALASGDDMAAIADLLEERALKAGGDDNITVALLSPGGGGAKAEIPTDPGIRAGKKRAGRRSGGRGGLIAGLLIVVLALTAWLILGRPFSQEPTEIPGSMPRDTAAGPASSDSSGWLDTTGYAPAGDSLHPGDTIAR